MARPSRTRLFGVGSLTLPRHTRFRVMVPESPAYWISVEPHRSKTHAKALVLGPFASGRDDLTEIQLEASWPARD